MSIISEISGNVQRETGKIYTVDNRNVMNEIKEVYRCDETTNDKIWGGSSGIVLLSGADFNGFEFNQCVKSTYYGDIYQRTREKDIHFGIWPSGTYMYAWLGTPVLENGAKEIEFKYHGNGTLRCQFYTPDNVKIYEGDKSVWDVVKTVDNEPTVIKTPKAVENNPFILWMGLDHFNADDENIYLWSIILK